MCGEQKTLFQEKSGWIEMRALIGNPATRASVQRAHHRQPLHAVQPLGGATGGPAGTSRASAGSHKEERPLE
eukprot:5060068-Prymnesium_polylepis.1